MVEKLHEFEETIDPIVQLFEDPEVQEYLEQKKYIPSFYLCHHHYPSFESSLCHQLQLK